MQYMLFKALSPKEYKTYTAIRLSMEEGKFTVRVFTGGMTCTEKVYMKILRFSVRQWIVLIGAALFQCALVGILVNSAGLFLAEVRLERQYSMSLISAHNTIRSVSGAVLGAFLVHLFHKKNKPVFLFLCVASIACGYLLMTIDLPEFAWFVIPVLLCPSASIGIVAVPYMLAPWFSTCSGFASGFAMAFSGVGGVIFNPIAATLIEKYGWRQAIVILAAIMFGVSLLGLYMVFHVSPQMQQRVDMEGSIKHRGLKETSRKKDIRKFMKCQICLIGSAVAVTLVNYMSLYITSIGYDLVFAAEMMSCLMLGNILGKLLFGLAVDLIGTWKTTACDLLLVAVGLCLLLYANSSKVILCIAALLFGNSYAGATLATTKCSVAMYGQEESVHWVGLHTSIDSIVAALFSMSIGLIFDASGSYEISFLIAITCVVIGCVVATANCINANIQSKID